MSFPEDRPRRLRRNPLIRKLVGEVELGPADLVLPVFVSEAIDSRREVPTMPGVFQETVESVVRAAEEAVSLGIPGLILFGIPAGKDPQGSAAWAEDGVVQKALRRVRGAIGNSLLLVADNCLDEYTDHGHCGVLTDFGELDNDATIELYAKTAVSQADAGADIIAPSGMMDGQVGAIRGALDEAGHSDTAILAYAAKYASSFYGPFRDAAECAPKSGDRRAHQMDPANRREAMREIEMDILEGADLLMIKPALPYLDVVLDARQHFDQPLGVFSVSGEYAMLRAGAATGGLDLKETVLESHLAMRRAGADFILSYFAREICRWLKEPA
ncbi:MAG TPA: porphobilinogen synthase [Candidatus Saccharimonadales bacterium]|nr:porphobilinogen synthase [Candidatus Saccharimonadales bacterium]